MSKNIGLREQVKNGIVSIDEAIEIAKDYNEAIQAWLLRRKKNNVKPSAVKEEKPKKKKRQQRKKKGKV